jgi:hypothetical protein
MIPVPPEHHQVWQYIANRQRNEPVGIFPSLNNVCVCYLKFDDSGQISTQIYDKRDDFNFKIINFPNMCTNIPASPAYGVYISQNIFDIFVDTLSLYIFTIWKSIVYNLFCIDGIYFDKILVSEYKLIMLLCNNEIYSSVLRHEIWNSGN